MGTSRRPKRNLVSGTKSAGRIFGRLATFRTPGKSVFRGEIGAAAAGGNDENDKTYVFG